MNLYLVAAVARNRVIGNHGSVPWHIPQDLLRFKSLTVGSTVLMGRKTYESIGKPLPNRRNIVLTKKPKNDIEAYTSIPLALEAVKDENQVFVIGGGDTFAQTIGIVERMFLTLIHRDVEGDTFFPPYEELLSNEFLLNREEHFNDFSFLDYIRKSKIIGVK